LVVGFACDVYRQEPRARIFVGNKLIDEFYIQHHKDTLYTEIKKFRQNKHILHPYSNTEFLNVLIKNFAPLRFYEIEIDQTKNLEELRIEIKNSDSNYINGFMSKSTLIRLNVCYFFPLYQKLLSRLKKIRNNSRLTQNYAWYHLYKNHIFDLLQNKLQWQGENTQIENSNSSSLKERDRHTLLKECDLGGDGVFTRELVKKYQILINKLKRSCRYNFDIMLIDYFFDKYQQHANQRNTN